MSLPQSRLEKSDSHFRKPGGGGGRSGAGSGGHSRNFTGGGRGRGGGAGVSAPGSSTAAPTGRSYKKTNNGQGGQTKGNIGHVNQSNSNAPGGARSVENGGHVHSTTLQGVSNAPAPTAVTKPADASVQKSCRPLPRAPSSQSSTVTSDSASPSTPSKGDGGKGFSLQFGSISPGFMNGMQVPARTSSAPPNLDEQKRDQARRDASRAVPPVPLPSVPKHDVPKKEAAPSQQPVMQQTLTETKAKRELQVASATPPTQPQKPSALPMSGISMPLPFHQPAVSMQFGGPSPQIQSQGMVTNSPQMPMQMPLQMGNPSQVPQQVFMPGFQHHLMQTQGIMHQGQNLGFNPQMGTQLPHQLGSLGMNMPNQFNQQQAGKLGSARKTVKITHPDTHEELRLDSKDGGSSGSRPHHSEPSQSQSLPTYTPTHPMGYYSNSYTASPQFFPAQSSIPMSSTQLTAGSQAPRFNYPASQAPQNMQFLNQSVSNTFPVIGGPSVSGNSGSSSLRDKQNLASSAQSASTPVTIRAAGGSGGEKVRDSGAVAKIEPQNTSKPAGEPVRKELDLKAGNSSLQSKIPASVGAETSAPGSSSAIPTSSPLESSSGLTHVESTKRETVVKSTSTEDIQKQFLKKGHPEPSLQVTGQADSIVLQDSGDYRRVVASESAEAKVAHPSSGHMGDASGAVQRSPVITDAAPGDVSVVALGSQNKSDTPESHETQNVVNEIAVDQHAKQVCPQEEIQGDSVVNKETSTEERMRVLPSNNSSKASDTFRETDRNSESKNVDLVPAVTEADQRQMVTNVANSDKIGAQASSSELASSSVADNISNSSSSVGLTDSLNCQENDASNSIVSENEVIPANIPDRNLEQEREVVDRLGSSSGVVTGSNKTSVEPNKMKNNKGKKKWKETLQKADALGTTSDLYMAYKGPEEKKENDVAAEDTSESKSKVIAFDAKPEERERENADEPSKSELDDWEDAADISTPKLESSGKGDNGGSLHDDEGVTMRKYSRDFLLTFAEQCLGLPEGFEITADVAGALMGGNINASRGDREYPAAGRISDRPAEAARVDRRGNSTLGADRWSKMPGPYPSGPDPGMDLAYGINAMGFRGAPGPHYGALRHPRAPGPVQPAGAILSGPLHSMGFPGMPRNNSDADRWQRGTNFIKGLMPPPQTPLQAMHKADRKYEVGKVTDDEQAKQRKLKSILNKLTPQNFEKLFEQVKEVNIDNGVTLTGVISQIFDKALMEPTFCEMYANFCYHLASELPDLSVDNEKITFRRLLLNKCQEEFERGEREEKEANEADGEGEGEVKLSEAQREEKRLKVRRRMLGNIRLIGELYKKRMLTERIMHECIKKLLGQYQNPDEENIEALCKLMSTIGEMIDHPKAKEHMDAYFDIMGQLSTNMKLSSRLRFMLKDAIDLRKNKWQQRRKVEGPKKIEEVHRDAAQERQGQAARLSRGPSMGSGIRRGGQPLDFGARGSMLSSPVGQGGVFRGTPSQARGYGQDARMDERTVYESRTLVPLRSSGDEPITLGPQGGLARGMAYRGGHPSVSSSPLLDTSPSFGDPRRMGGGFSGYGAASERGTYSSREDHFVRHTSDRFGAPIAYDQSNIQELSTSRTNRDHRHPDPTLDKSRPRTPVARVGGTPADNVSSDKVLSEERLREMSLAAIREYYSAKDEKEVALCLKDLNAPGFYPTVVSIWVSDSFERKDMERDMLAKLLVNLTKPRGGTFDPSQLIEGFEDVLTILEDTVNDAPRAPEFLGRLFGKFVMDNVLPLKEVGRLIHEGGEEPGQLLKEGLAADVLGNVLEMIKSEKGEPVLNEIRAGSNLRLEDFRTPGHIRSRKLEMFM